MNSEVVREKLESLRRCVVRVADKVPNSAADLARDVDAQDVIVLNLTRAVQICIDISSHIISHTDCPAPATMSEAFTALHKLSVISGDVAKRMKSAVGFRNVAVHCYDDLNLDIVYAISTRQLGDFKLFALAISKCLNDE